MITLPDWSDPLVWGCASAFGGGVLLTSLVAWGIAARRRLRCALQQGKTESDLRHALQMCGSLEGEALQLRTELSEIREENASLRASNEHLRSEEKRWLERLAFMEDRFRTLSTDILTDNSSRLKSDNSEQMHALLGPLREQLSELRREITTARAAGEGNKSAVEALVRRMMDNAAVVAKDVATLSHVLKGNARAQGDWGEMVLEGLLEDTGLRKGCEYLVQPVYHQPSGKDLRPDVVVRFPGERCLIIDSKVSLTAYAQYAQAADASARDKFMKAHLSSIRTHVQELSSRHYTSHVPGAVELVVMFMPNEAACLAALRQAPELLQESVRKGVLLVSPTNLYMTLRLAALLWQKERQKSNVSNIIDRAASILEKCRLLEESFDRLGRSLQAAQVSYDEAMGRFRSGSGCLTDQVHSLAEMGVLTRK